MTTRISFRFVLGVLLAITTSSFGATIALWTFEPPHPAPFSSNNVVSGVLPAIGTGEASGFHSSTPTSFFGPVGNGVGQAMGSDKWAIGDYWQFALSSSGFRQLTISFDQTSYPSGPTNFTLSYSLNGTDFSPILSYRVLEDTAGPLGGGGAWNGTTFFPAYNRVVNLAANSEVNNAPTLYFRFTSTSAPAFFGGDVSMIDNVRITGAVIPEPATIQLLLLSAIMACAGRWGRRR